MSKIIRVKLPDELDNTPLSAWPAFVSNMQEVVALMWRFEILTDDGTPIPPPPPPPPPPTTITAKVLGINLRVRSEARADAPLVRTMGPGTIIQVEPTPTRVGDYDWYKLSDGNWCAGYNYESKVAYLDIAKTDTPPVIPPPPPPPSTAITAPVKVQNGRLVKLDGTPLALFGANVGGWRRTVPFEFQEFGDDTFVKLLDMVGGKPVAVRVFATKEYAGDTTDINEMVQYNLAMLNHLKRIDGGTGRLLAFFVLNEALVSKASLKEELPYHTGPDGRLNGKYWQERKWQDVYIPFLEKLAPAVASHPNLGGFMLGNEFAFDDPYRNLATLNLFKEMVNAATKILRKHSTAPIGLDVISTHHLTDAISPVDFYSSIDVDIITGHFYQASDASDVAQMWGEEPYGKADLEAIKTLKARGKDMAYIVSEWGQVIDRFDSVAAAMLFLKRQIAQGAAGVWVWPLYHGTHNSGWVDNKYGLGAVIRDNIRNPDYGEGHESGNLVHRIWEAENEVGW